VIYVESNRQGIVEWMGGDYGATLAFSIKHSGVFRDSSFALGVSVCANPGVKEAAAQQSCLVPLMDRPHNFHSFRGLKITFRMV